MSHRVVTVMLVSLACAAPAAAQQLAAHPAVVYPTYAVDPVGDYTWSFVTNGTTVNGTLTIARKDSTLTGLFTSDQLPDALPARSVSLDGNRLTVTAAGDFGEFTAWITFNDARLDGTFKLVDPNGGSDTGPLTVARVQK